MRKIRECHYAFFSSLKKAYNEKGVTLFEIHEYDKAICCFDKCIEIDPTDSDYYANKAATLLNIEQYDNALEVINKAIELNSNDSSTHNIRGRLNNKIFINYTIYLCYKKFRYYFVKFKKL